MMANTVVLTKREYQVALVAYKNKYKSGGYLRLLQKYRIFDNNLENKKGFLQHIIDATATSAKIRNRKAKRQSELRQSSQHAYLRKIFKPYAMTIRAQNLTSASLQELLSDVILGKTNDFCNVSLTTSVSTHIVTQHRYIGTQLKHIGLPLRNVITSVPSIVMSVV